MKVHELKTWPEVFVATKDGFKTAEFRLDDRGYKEGDELILHEYNPQGLDHQRYSGRQTRVLVRHIVKGGQFGIPEGYVVMSVVLCNKVKV